MGGTRGCAHGAGRDFAESARIAAPPLGDAAAVAQAGRLGEDVSPSEARPDDARAESGALRLARTASRGAHHVVAGAYGVEELRLGELYAGNQKPARQSWHERNPARRGPHSGHRRSA